MPEFPARALLCAVALISASTLATSAGEISVTLQGGGPVLRGQVLDFDGTTLRILTEHGPVSLDFARVDCDGADCPDPVAHVPELRLAGAASIGQRLLPALLESFAEAEDLQLIRRADAPGTRPLSQTHDLFSTMRRTPILTVTTDFRGDDAGLLALMRGAADATLSFAQIEDPDFRNLPLGFDAFVAVASDPVPVPELPLDALARAVADARRGGAPGWSTLGGPNRSLRLHLRNSKVPDPLETGVQPIEERAGNNHDNPAIRQHISHQGLLRAVDADPHGLGITLRSAVPARKGLPLRDRCGTSIAPTPDALRTGAYPLTQPLWLIVPRQRISAIAYRFLRHATSPAASAALRSAALVDFAPLQLDGAAQMPRLLRTIDLVRDHGELETLQRMARLMARTDRLSLRLRIEPDTPFDETMAAAELAALAHSMRTGTPDPARVWLIGFSAHSGSQEEIGQRARMLAEGLRQRLMDVLDPGPGMPRPRIEGFPAWFLPDCTAPDSANAGAVERVEVWVER